MRNVLPLIASVAFISSVAAFALANDKELESKCRDQATKENVASNRTEAYVQSCISNNGNMGSAKNKGTDNGKLGSEDPNNTGSGWNTELTKPSTNSGSSK